jgi:hypothetical protein
MHGAHLLIGTLVATMTGMGMLMTKLNGILMLTMMFLMMMIGDLCDAICLLKMFFV